MLDRLRRGRRLVVSTAVLTVVATALATVGLAGVAVAEDPGDSVGTTPILQPYLVPVYQDGPQTHLKSNTANQPVPDMHMAVNSNSDLPGFSVWTAGDTFSLLLSPGDPCNAPPFFFFPFGPNCVEDGNWIGWSAVPTVSVSGGPASGGTPPIVSCSIKAFPADSVATQVSVRDLLECVFVNSSVDDALTPYTIDFSGIKLTTGPDPQGTNDRIRLYVQYGAGALDGDGYSILDARQYPLQCAAGVAGCLANAGGHLPCLRSRDAGDRRVRDGEQPAGVGVAGRGGCSGEPGVDHRAPRGRDRRGLPVHRVGCEWRLVVEQRRVADGDGGVDACGWGDAPRPDHRLRRCRRVVRRGNGSDSKYLLISIDAESSEPTTITISGLLVNAGSSIGAQQARAFLSSNASCEGEHVDLPGDQHYTHNYFTVFSVGNATINTRIAGSNLEQTAVAALEAAFPSTEPGDGCLDANASPDPGEDDPGSSVVLATTATWQDALAASYLASFLDTGVLLTPPDHLSKYTENAIRNEGVTSVYIVGGNLAVSKAVADQLKDTPQYHCGGANVRQGDLGGNLLVHRIWGATDLDTAMEVATFVNSGFVNFHSGGFDLSGVALPVGSPIPNIYARGGGTDTSQSLATIRVRTAILATNNTWQDAAAAGSLSYYEQMPVILTARGALSAQARTALLDLGIQQVVLLGGPIAISDQVVSDLSAIGVKSLRISGVDHTDTAVQLATFEVNPNAGLNGHDAGLDWGTYDECFRDTFEKALAYGCFVMAVARGDFYADALTSSVVTGRINGIRNREFYEGPQPILLTIDPNTIGGPLTGFLNRAGSPYGVAGVGYPWPVAYAGLLGHGKWIIAITPFGGILAISDATLQGMLDAISAGANPA